MYTLKAARIPDSGTLRQTGLRLSLQELGLGQPFLAEGVELDFELTRMLETVFGRVSARARVRLECSRCLKAFFRDVEARFQVQFEPEGRAGAGEEDPEDPGVAVAFYQGEELALGEEVRQELELLVPFQPLCSDGCLGLCARCGADLNQGGCACPKGPEGGPFTSLENLLQDTTARKDEA